jgi:anti-anti-sigma regulatory factor
MLRITLKNSCEVAVLKLEGRLSGPWVGELERTWCEVTSKTPADSVVLDLSDVTFVDAEGKKLLSGMFRRGAELRNGSLMTRYIVNQIKQAEIAFQANGGY